jgi:hypothetical protein
MDLPGLKGVDESGRDGVVDCATAREAKVVEQSSVH